MNSSFEYTATLEYRLKAANAQVLAFKSGEKYIRMQEEYLKKLRSLERKIRKLEDELSSAHSEIVSVRNQWFEIFEELQNECVLETALEGEKGENLKLRTQINRDYENSSIPPSKTLCHKKIANSREKSGRKSGTQPGHPGHIIQMQM